MKQVTNKSITVLMKNIEKYQEDLAFLEKKIFEIKQLFIGIKNEFSDVNYNSPIQMKGALSEQINELLNSLTELQSLKDFQNIEKLESIQLNLYCVIVFCLYNLDIYETLIQIEGIKGKSG